MHLVSTLLAFCFLLVILPNFMDARKTGHHVHPRGLVKHRRIHRRTNQTAAETTQPESGDLTEKFYNHCDDIFRESSLVSHVIRGMIGGISDRLNEVCVGKPIHPIIHTLFTETLLCEGSLSEAIDSIVDVLFSQFDRKCEEITNFQSIYVLTVAENEVVKTHGAD
ncbi:uncharacterized protein LOC108098464 [Drosophila ficusphila]|uniref:uncharacterized protein LOC108098464 n=1 Tax=Drosophila ficusphila TaxID=30025 RepID=UPI0007E71E88|nr:uncharacterized protein LOC108098464 [Drosophila ficusphila]